MRRIARAGALAKVEKRRILLQGKIETEKMRLQAQRELEELRRALRRPAVMPQLPAQAEHSGNEIIIDVTWEEGATDEPSPKLLERARGRVEYQ